MSNAAPLLQAGPVESTVVSAKVKVFGIAAFCPPDTYHNGASFVSPLPLYRISADYIVASTAAQELSPGIAGPGPMKISLSKAPIKRPGRQSGGKGAIFSDNRHYSRSPEKIAIVRRRTDFFSKKSDSPTR
jgi:hypothetical protein